MKYPFKIWIQSLRKKEGDKNVYDELVFVSGFFFNIILATSLSFLGVHLGVDLYLAAVFAFGVRLFQNIAVIRRILLTKFSSKSLK